MSVASTTSQNFPPGPRSLIPGKVFRELRRDPLAFLTRLTHQYGDVSSFRAAGRRYVVLNHPDLAREVLMTQADAFWKSPALQNSKGILGEGLLTAEGDTHKQQRRLMQPSFHARHVENYAGAIVQSTHEVIAAWEQTLARGPTMLDVRPPMMGLTLVIAGRALFGTMLADDIQTVHRCMDDLMNNFVRAVVPWGKILNRLPLPSTRKLARAQSDLFALVERMIATRRAGTNQDSNSNAGPQDLLSTMIAATDPEAPAPLTDTQLRDQAVTILTAGHETTANAMTFTLYLLAKHPESQRRLHEEVVSVLEGTAVPTSDMLDRLPFTRCVLSESMRLLPPVWTLGRQNRRAVDLGGYTLPPLCTILIPQWTLHRDRRLWDEPLSFNPDRWRNPVHPRFAYIPFSTGPRNCIGESFAWLESMLALPMLIRQFEFHVPPNEPELRLTPALTLRPRGPVNLLLAGRKGT